MEGGKMRSNSVAAVASTHVDTSISKSQWYQAWFDEFETTAAALENEAITALQRERLNISVAEPFDRSHRFGEAEWRRMCGYESLDYEEPQSQTYREYLANRPKVPVGLRMGVYVLVGASVALFGVVFCQCTQAFTKARVALVEQVINDGRLSDDADLPSGALLRGYCVLVCWCSVAALSASLLCLFCRAATSTGIPDVIAYLNGISFPHIFNIRVVAVKTLSCLLGLTAGLPIGLDGPMIHVGALLGGIISTGRSKTLSCHAMDIFRPLRNNKDRRDFVAAGAAAGIAGAFDSPVAGLLFVVEEVASRMSSAFSVYTFTCCLVCGLVMQAFNSYLLGWRPRDRSGYGPLDLIDDVVTMLDTSVTRFQHVDMNIFSVLPSFICGCVLGITAVAFTVIAIRLAHWRCLHVSHHITRRMAEPTIVAFVLMSLCFACSALFPCTSIPEPFRREEDLKEIQLVTAFCKNHHTEFSPFASLALTNPYNAGQLLFSRNTGDLIPIFQLLTFLLLYGVSAAAVAGGVFLSHGFLIPAVLIGSVAGRFLGQVLDEPWSDPGIIALVGAAAFLGGLSRLTFSLTIMMLAVCNDHTHIALIILGVLLSKTVADRCCHSLFHQLLEMKCIPYLDDQVHISGVERATAKEVMATPVISIYSTEHILRILELLHGTTHNVFPVVSAKDGKTFIGNILRAQIEMLLWYVHVSYEVEETPLDEIVHPSCEELIDLEEQAFLQNLRGIPDLSPAVVSCAIDFTPFVDMSATYIYEDSSLQSAYAQFRALSLRQLPVLNREGQVVGVITRKDLVWDNVVEQLRKSNARIVSQRLSAGYMGHTFSPRALVPPEDLSELKESPKIEDKEKVAPKTAQPGGGEKRQEI